MSPEKAALARVWSNKRFWLVQSVAFAVWATLAMSWFWLPDSHVWGLALAVVQGLAVMAGAAWLVRKALLFYGPPAALGKAALRPRLYADIAALALLGVYAPYRLIAWHPRVAGVAMQTVSLVVRFMAAFLLAVSAWLVLAALLGTDRTAARSKSSASPLAPQSAQPNP